MTNCEEISRSGYSRADLDERRASIILRPSESAQCEMLKRSMIPAQRTPFNRRANRVICGKSGSSTVFLIY